MEDVDAVTAAMGAAAPTAVAAGDAVFAPALHLNALLPVTSAAASSATAVARVLLHAVGLQDARSHRDASGHSAARRVPLVADAK